MIWGLGLVAGRAQSDLNLRSKLLILQEPLSCRKQKSIQTIEIKDLFLLPVVAGACIGRYSRLVSMTVNA